MDTQTWELAQVLPHPKNTAPNNFTDIHPISKLTILSKIFEFIHLQLQNFFVSKFTICLVI